MSVGWAGGAGVFRRNFSLLAAGFLAYRPLPSPPWCQKPVSGLRQFQEPAAWEARVVGLLVPPEFQRKE